MAHHHRRKHSSDGEDDPSQRETIPIDGSGEGSGLLGESLRSPRQQSDHHPPPQTAAAGALAAALAPPNSDSVREDDPKVPLRKVFALSQLLGLFAVSFGYAFVFNSINNIVIPKEIERLTSSRQSMWVGMIMAAGALSQLTTPIIGAWSDRYGQRHSFLVYGTVVTVVGIVLFLLVGTLEDMLMLFIAHVVTATGLAVQYSMLTALLNDHVAEEQMGKGSGAMAILAILGSGSGYVLFAMGVPLHYNYCADIITSVICLGITTIFLPAGAESQAPRRGAVSSFPRHNSNAPHRSSSFVHDSARGGPPRTASGGASVSIGPTTSGQSPNSAGSTSHDTGSVKCGETIVHALSMPSPSKHPDFFFACLSRGLFNTGLAGQVYLVYYLRDILHVETPVQTASIMAVMALFGGVVGALPAGMLSDRVGKKPVIYWSVFICILSLIFIALTEKAKMMAFIGFVYGIGNVSYLSVDYALGVQSLPRRVADPAVDDGERPPPLDAAKDLGVFAMSATVGQLSGQVLYGSILEQFASQTSSGMVHYGHAGFLLMYGAGAGCFLFAALAARFVKSVR